MVTFSAATIREDASDASRFSTMEQKLLRYAKINKYVGFVLATLTIIACIILNWGSLISGESQPKWYSILTISFYETVAVLLIIAMSGLLITLKRNF